MLNAHKLMILESLNTAPKFTPDYDYKSFAGELYNHVLNYVDMKYSNSYNAIIKGIPDGVNNPRAFNTFISSLNVTDNKVNNPTLADVWPK